MGASKCVRVYACVRAYSAFVRVCMCGVRARVYV